MSDKKEDEETKKKFKSSDEKDPQKTEKEEADNDPASRKTSADSSKSGASSAGTSGSTSRLEKMASRAAKAAGVKKPEIIVTIPRSKLSSPKSAIKKCATRLGSLSPKRKSDSSQSQSSRSPQRSSIAEAASGFRRAVLRVSDKACARASGAILSVKDGFWPDLQSPDRSNIVFPPNEFEPPVKVPKKKPDFYCGIPTHATREMMTKEKNPTDTSSLSSTNEAPSIPSDDSSEESSPSRERAPLLKPDKSPSKEKSPSKDKSPRRKF